MKHKSKSTRPVSNRGAAPEPPTPKVSLLQIEQEVLEEGREWTRRRLQQRLQQLADQHGEISPLEPQTNPSLPAAGPDSVEYRRGD